MQPALDDARRIYAEQFGNWKSINRIEPADPPSDGEVPCAEILDFIRTHGGAAAIDKYGAAHVRAAMIPED